MQYIQTTAVNKILSCKKRIKIFQGGSCFVEGTLIQTKKGLVPIQSLRKGDSVLSLSLHHEIIESEIYDHWENAPNKPLISFRLGKETFTATYDHKFYTPEGYQELYRVVWGSLDSSQRIQLELLCKQYGTYFDPHASWRKATSHNEAISNNTGEKEQTVQGMEDSVGQEDDSSPQSSSTFMDTKHTELSSGRPHKRKHTRQSSREPGLGNGVRKHNKGIQNRSYEEETGRAEREFYSKRPASNGDAFRMGHLTQIQSETVGGEIWGIGSLYKGYSGTQNLLPFTPKQIQIQEPKKTFAISVKEENYFIGERGYNVSNSAGKTIAILLIFIDRACCEKNKIFSVVSETIPHLKKGAIRDFLSIMEGHGYYDDNAWNRTDFIYTFPTGTKIEFFSADSPDKVRGPRRNVLFINEANNISYETYTQLAIRTSEEIYIDYNPVSEFWVHDELIPHTDHDFTILTYKDNEGLPQSIIDDLESRRHKTEWAKVYLDGQLGGAEGVIYPRWPQVDSVPEGARLERYGIDFGYSNDPTAIVAVYYYNQGYILDEILFQKGVSNKQIADTILNQEHMALTIADAAEPKSIDEIRSYGVLIQPAVKGQGSVLNGIQIVQDQNIQVTKRSTNVIKANKNYVWDTDIDGKPTNRPDHFWSDSMDAVRYAMSSIVPLKNRQEMVLRMPRVQRAPRKNPAR